MKTFNDLTPQEQNEFRYGIVELNGTGCECRWRYNTHNSMVEIYTEADDYSTSSHIDSSSIVAEWDSNINEWQRRLI